MTPAKNLPLYPDKAPKPSRRREKGTYGLVDNPVLAYQKTRGAADTRVLTALVERDNFTFKPSQMSVAELQIETELCERAVQKALKVLEVAGLCHREGKVWAYGEAPNEEANARANSQANEEANSRTDFSEEIAVQHDENPALKSLEVVRSQKNTNNTLLGSQWPAQLPEGAAAGAALASKTETARPVQDQAAHPQEGTINVTDNEKVAPAGAAPQTYRAAQAALTRAGAWDIWQTWVRGVPALGRNRAAQDAQIVQFAGWVVEGFADQLRENVKNIVEAGTFAHPYNALKARMEKLRAVQHAEKERVVELRRVFGEAQCQPGERRRAPNGQVWTVEAVEYGIVFFAEAGAPLDVTDREAAGWAVEA